MGEIKVERDRAIERHGGDRSHHTTVGGFIQTPTIHVSIIMYLTNFALGFHSVSDLVTTLNHCCSVSRDYPVDPYCNDP